MDKVIVPLRVAVLAVADQAPIRLVADRLSQLGHLVERESAPETEDAIRTRVGRWVHDLNVEIVIVLGGSETTDADTTRRAIGPLVTRDVPHFGELVRWVSYDKLKTPAPLSRANAVMCQSTLVLSMPGPLRLVETVLETVVIPMLDPSTDITSLAALLPRFRKSGVQTAAAPEPESDRALEAKLGVEAMAPPDAPGPKAEMVSRAIDDALDDDSVADVGSSPTVELPPPAEMSSSATIELTPPADGTSSSTIEIVPPAEDRPSSPAIDASALVEAESPAPPLGGSGVVSVAALADKLDQAELSPRITAEIEAAQVIMDDEEPAPPPKKPQAVIVETAPPPTPPRRMREPTPPPPLPVGALHARAQPSALAIALEPRELRAPDLLIATNDKAGSMFEPQPRNKHQTTGTISTLGDLPGFSGTAKRKRGISGGMLALAGVGVAAVGAAAVLLIAPPWGHDSVSAEPHAAASPPPAETQLPAPAEAPPPAPGEAPPPVATPAAPTAMPTTPATPVAAPTTPSATPTRVAAHAPTEPVDPITELQQQPATPKPAAPANGEVAASLDAAMVRAGTTDIRDLVVACGDSAPSASGTVKVHVAVDPDGSVKQTEVRESPDAALGRCVATVLKTAHFARTQSGGSFTYPFAFTASAPAAAPTAAAPAPAPAAPAPAAAAPAAPATPAPAAAAQGAAPAPAPASGGG